jgi:hypothetical protein
MSRFVYLGLVLLLAAGCVPALASTEKLDDALRRCAQQSDQAQRLACFDAIVSTLAQVEADRFGMTADIERKRDPVVLQHARDEVLGGKIAGLRQAAHGEWIFTLDNRQTWIEAEPRPNVEFALGEDVHIEHGAMSSLWLVADNHRKVRIKRLQ